MKSNECDAKNVCDCVVSGEERDRDSAMTQHRIAESVRQRESEFTVRVAFVFMMLACVLLAASLLSEYYWSWHFDRLYELNGIADNATKSVDIQAYQALKPLLNITMYAIPKTLGFIGLGFVLVGTMLIVMERFSALFRRYHQRRQHKRAR